MTSTAATLKYAVAAATWIRERTQPKTSSVLAPGLVGIGGPPPWGLVRQIFFPSAEVTRHHILFAGAGAETSIFDFCKTLGLALAELTGAMVAIVEASSGEEMVSVERRAGSGSAADSWRVCSSEIAERVWSVPSVWFSGECNPGSPNWMSTNVKELDATFDYVLFASRIGDSETHLFSSMCDAAVLVLTANRTHKEIALRAKEELLRHNVTLLGAVLDQRTFLIPEFIYRRL